MSSSLPTRQFNLLLVQRCGQDPWCDPRNDPALNVVTATEHEASSGAASRNDIDIVLIDSRLPEPAWRAVLAGAQRPAILFGSAHFDECVIPAMVAGVSGYLSDDEIPHRIREAVETVLNYGIYAGPALSWRLFVYLAEMSESSSPMRCDAVELPHSAELTFCEAKILNLVAQGLSNQSIADALHVSPHTVANHVHNLLRKLNARHRWEAVTKSSLSARAQI
jgi:DNA-binding NarL/FixJ family response regulator